LRRSTRRGAGLGALAAAWALLMATPAGAQAAGAQAEQAAAPAAKGAAAAEAAATAGRAERHTWDPATVETMATLPIQEGGRTKPLSMFAAYTLYFVHGRRDMKLDLDGDDEPDVVLTPTEWLLDVWCFPELAADYPLLRIENTAVLDAIGVANLGQRFEFEYASYRELLTPGKDGQMPAQRLVELASRYRRKPAGQRSPVERHIVDSADQLQTYHDVHIQLEGLHRPALPLEGAALQQAFGGRQHATVAELVAGAPQLRDLVRRYRDQPEDPALGNTMQVAAVLANMAQTRDGAAPALFPPPGPRTAAEEWLELGGDNGLVDAALFGRAGAEQAAMLQHLQAALTASDHQTRQRELVAFRDAVVARARARGEFDKIELESYYLAASWHYRALHWFLLGLLVVALGWLAPKSKWLWRAGVALTALPLGFLVADIALRCVIRGRPPILNLYDTFLFIAAVGVLSALVAELITKRRIALSLAPPFGALLIMLARAFEVEEGKDQLAPLQAVLDTNYYLATHVTAINMGYAAAMLASVLGTTWLVLQALGVRRHDQTFYKSIVRATYGVAAFGLVFAVFGTIYGGVWANDSWGRFWGWDPKENGALLICISLVALFHARMTGMVRDFGFSVWSALTGLVVAFSWFHVNLLEIGLHSYGFASSTEGTLLAYYYIEGGVVGLSALVIYARRAWAHRAARLAQSPATT
jgi:ABC-type transport system involved in cytochrome c biogenesis permease subunit